MDDGNEIVRPYVRKTSSGPIKPVPNPMNNNAFRKFSKRQTIVSNAVEIETRNKPR